MRVTQFLLKTSRPNLSLSLCEKTGTPYPLQEYAKEAVRQTAITHLKNRNKNKNGAKAFVQNGKANVVNLQNESFSNSDLIKKI